VTFSRVLAALLIAGLSAISGLAGAASAVLGASDARHFLTRTGFGASPAEIEAYANLTRAQAVERLLAGTHTQAVTAPPAWAAEPFHFQPLAGLTREERMQLQRERRRKGLELRTWWLEEMRVTPSPFTERMTLFWHNHFVVSDAKVRFPQLVQRRNALIREHALGNFATLLHEASRDPAMVIYLDNASNRKGQPNENFAREVMELFTLGEGHYTEQDVKEAARAFTGWSFDAPRGEFVLRTMQHDDGAKTLLGQTGDFSGDDVLRILLAHPRTAEHIVEKLWREFVSPAPDRAQVERVARRFRDSGYDTPTALRALLESDAFYAPENRASLVKSPVDLVIGTLRQFHFSTGEMLPFAFTTNQLGQNLFAPPNVKGWPGGEAWINSHTLLARKGLLERLFRDADSPAMGAMAPQAGTQAPAAMDSERERVARARAAVRFDAGRWLGALPPGDEALQRVVLAAPPVTPLPEGAAGVEALRLLTQDPVYQLK